MNIHEIYLLILPTQGVEESNLTEVVSSIFTARIDFVRGENYDRTKHQEIVLRVP